MDNFCGRDHQSCFDVLGKHLTRSIDSTPEPVRASVEGEGVTVDAVRTVEAEVRELIRRSGLDPAREPQAVQRLVRDAVADYDQRSMHGGMPVLGDVARAEKSVWDTVAGFGPLQQYFDDPTVEEIWINEPTRVFVARGGVAELTTTLLTGDEVRDLVERMLKSSGRRVDLSRARSSMRCCPTAPGCTWSSPTSPASTGTSTSASSSSRPTASTTSCALGTLTRQAATFPRGGRRVGPQRARRRRNPGGQDDPAQLPRVGDPGARARRHVRRGLRAEDPACATSPRCSAASPVPRGHRRGAVAAPRQGGAADAAVAGSSSARCARPRASTCSSR